MRARRTRGGIGVGGIEILLEGIQGLMNFGHGWRDEPRLVQADFKKPTTAQQYGEYVKFKFEIISYLYKKWAKIQIIARPIDVFMLPSDGYRNY